MAFNKAGQLISKTVDWVSHPNWSYSEAMRLTEGLRSLLSKFHQGFSVREHRLLVSTQRRIECILPPLQYCIIWSSYKNSAIRPIIFHIQQILHDVFNIIQPFLDKSTKMNLYSCMGTKECSEQAVNDTHRNNYLSLFKQVDKSDNSSTKITSNQSCEKDLEHCSRELDLTFTLLNLAMDHIKICSNEPNLESTRLYNKLSSHNTHKYPNIEASKEHFNSNHASRPISPSALVKAFQHLKDFDSKSGDMTYQRGKLFYTVITQTRPSNIDSMSDAEDCWVIRDISEWSCLYSDAIMKLVKQQRDSTYLLSVETYDDKFLSPQKEVFYDKSLLSPQFTALRNTWAINPPNSRYGFNLSSGMFTTEEDTEDLDLVYLPDKEEIDKTLMGFQPGVSVENYDIRNLINTTYVNSKELIYDTGKDFQHQDRKCVILKGIGDLLNLKEEDRSSSFTFSHHSTENFQGLPSAIPSDLAAAITCSKICFPISTTLNARLSTTCRFKLPNLKPNIDKESNVQNFKDFESNINKKLMLWYWEFQSEPKNFDSKLISKPRSVVLSDLSDLSKQSPPCSPISNLIYQDKLFNSNDYNANEIHSGCKENNSGKSLDVGSCQNANDVSKTNRKITTDTSSNEGSEPKGYNFFEQPQGLTKKAQDGHLDMENSDQPDQSSNFSNKTKKDMDHVKEMTEPFRNQKLKGCSVGSPNCNIKRAQTQGNEEEQGFVHKFTVVYAFNFDSEPDIYSEDGDNHKELSFNWSFMGKMMNELTELDFLYLCRLSVLKESSGFGCKANSKQLDYNPNRFEFNDEILHEILKNIYL